ncbi:MAG: hypothetical protein Q4F05_03500 [bacterium]|nr:hypothetical protein [bacterium]
MRLLQRISCIIVIICLVLMGVNFFIHPLNDWIVRIVGSILLLMIVTISFSTVRLHKK